MADFVSLDEIRAAAERLLGVTVRTPLLAFPGAATAVGANGAMVGAVVLGALALL